MNAAQRNRAGLTFWNAGTTACAASNRRRHNKRKNRGNAPYPWGSLRPESEELAAAFEKHHNETEGHVERLEKVFQIIDEKPQGKTCDAIVGITNEGSEIMKEYKGSPALDAGLLAAVQAVEHYEISRYGTLIAWAGKLGHEHAVELLSETLEEEKATDEALTELAETAINAQAEEDEVEAE